MRSGFEQTSTDLGVAKIGEIIIEIESRVNYSGIRRVHYKLPPGAVSAPAPVRHPVAHRLPSALASFRLSPHAQQMTGGSAFSRHRKPRNRIRGLSVPPKLNMTMSLRTGSGSDPGCRHARQARQEQEAVEDCARRQDPLRL